MRNAKMKMVLWMALLLCAVGGQPVWGVDALGTGGGTATSMPAGSIDASMLASDVTTLINARASTAVLAGYAPDAVAFVTGSTDDARGQSLVNILAAWRATAPRPGGNALGASNRAAIVITGNCKVTPTTSAPGIALDINHVDLVGLSGDPSTALIYSAAADETFWCTVYQTAATVHMTNVGIANLAPLSYTDPDQGLTQTRSVPPVGQSGLVINTASSNANSYYRNCNFYVGTLTADGDSPGTAIACPVFSLSDMVATWEGCQSSSNAWRAAAARVTNGDSTGLSHDGAAQKNQSVTAARVGSTVTFTFTSAHPFHAGESVLITGATSSGLNMQKFSVLSSPVPTTLTFAVTSASGTLDMTTAAFRLGATAISAATRDGTHATYSASAHGMIVGDIVRVSGFTDSTWNGAYQITSKATGTFTVASAASSGSATMNGLEFAQGPGRKIGGTFRRCKSVNWSWGGDQDAVTVTALIDQCIGGDACVGGCGTFGCDVGMASVIRDSHFGSGSIALDRWLAGTCINVDCVSGSFAASTDSVGGMIAPTAALINCRLSSSVNNLDQSTYSFAGGPYGHISGRLDNCVASGLHETLRLAGAKLRGCAFQTTATDGSVLTLLDGNSSVQDCTLISNGSGYGIYAASGTPNVTAVHNRMRTTTSGVTVVPASGNGNVVDASIGW